MKDPGYKLFTLIAVIVVILGMMIFGIALYRISYQAMVSHPPPKPIIINFKRNTSATALIDELKSRNLIHSDRFLLAMISLKGLTNHLKAGVYQIQPEESALDFVNRVAAGDVLKESFTIVEGTTQKQVIFNLKSAPYLYYSDSDWAVIDTPHPSVEGLLLADTYIYEAGSQASSLINHAYTELGNYLEKSWKSRMPDLPYKTSYELLIVASILEKETAVPQEKRLIAGVIVNRLKKRMPLQVDPTVIYALGDDYQGKLNHKGLKVDSPYNTYKYRGLPPTPIAMVGKDAIDAAAHPKMTDYLYFVAKGDGTHHFSATYDEQKQAIQRYLK